MSNHQIMIIRVNQRVQNSELLQKVLTTYGCGIRTRLGLHEAGLGKGCANDGLILLQLAAGAADYNVFLDELNAIAGVTAKLVEI